MVQKNTVNWSTVAKCVQNVCQDGSSFATAAAKSGQISPVTKCKYTASVDIQRRNVKIVTYSLSYAAGATVSVHERRKHCNLKAISQSVFLASLLVKYSRRTSFCLFVRSLILVVISP